MLECILVRVWETTKMPCVDVFNLIAQFARAVNKQLSPAGSQGFDTIHHSIALHSRKNRPELRIEAQEKITHW